ncbi:MAG: maltose alpha-D-glucosyltransferase [Planctomycetes bacterium]|nr:maltose alpha-D-glucosyltransferase [Planctomycetota bacterium]
MASNVLRLSAEEDPLWYKDAVIYEVHVRAFCDSDADGIGDFRGLTERLDYLRDLGVTALWVLPFYPSPLKDDGYDIADYTDVNPIYGTLADFKRFLREAHRRGMHVITELVVNHTSDQHPWFQRARRAAPGTPERDFYVWSDTADKYKDARIIFNDFESSNWAWDPVAKAYYWHRFYAHQPDLNYDNPAVQEAILAAIDFWIDMGIDGFRLDAVPYLYEREGTNCENLPETHAFLKKLRAHVDARRRSRMLLAEANQWPEDAVAYFGQGDECEMAFHFPVMPRLFMAIQMEDRFPVIDILQQTPAIPANCQWALFLRNHDELTLEMVTDEDRDYMVRVYAQDAHSRINLGIRRRLAPLLENHRAKIELMNGLLLSLPGTPVIYYGDEIGMGDNIYLGDRNGVRTPMQWSPERNAGFSKGNPQRLYLPVIIDPEYHYQTINVEGQQNNTHSLLWWMKRLIALRKRYQAFGRGTLEFLYPKNHKVLAYLRKGDGGPTILVVANLSRFVQYVELDLAAFRGLAPVETMGRTRLPLIGDLPYLLTLGPYAFYWLALEPTPVDAAHAPTAAADLPFLEVSQKWEHVFGASVRESLEIALLGYLRKQAWFSAKGKDPRAVRITENIPIARDGAVWILAILRVEFVEGEPDACILPVGFVADSHDPALAAKPRDGICRLKVTSPASGNAASGNGDFGNAASENRASENPSSAPATPEDEKRTGLLYDPTGDKDFSQALLNSFARRRRFRGNRGELFALPAPAFARLRGSVDPEPRPGLVSGENSSSVVLGDRLFLKIYRWVEEGVHPEMELERALAEKTEFRHAAPVAGALEYRSGARQPMTVAGLFGFVANEGDAWNFTRDALHRFFVDVLTKYAQEKKPPMPDKPLLDAVAEEVPAFVVEAIGPYLESARLIGRRTAEMHVALAGVVTDADFAPAPFTIQYQRSIYQTVRSEALQAFESLRDRMRDLPEDARSDAERLMARNSELHASLRRILERRIIAQRTRGHGDYHLSSLLHTGKDFAIVDFEGELMLPLSNRRHKRSPLRDVASLLHSWHFAARTAMRKGDVRPEDIPVLIPWTRFWHVWVSVAFMQTYLEIASSASFLPKVREEMQILLNFYLLGRGVFELRHFLVNRLDVANIPMRALLYLLDLQSLETKGQPAPQPV